VFSASVFTDTGVWERKSSTSYSNVSGSRSSRMNYPGDIVKYLSKHILS
jgi:hypothetical protein